MSAIDRIVQAVDNLGNVDSTTLSKIRQVLSEQIKAVVSESAFVLAASQALDNLQALGMSGAVFERFEFFDAPEHLEMITLSCDDFTARCPITEQPDFYSVDITYQPSRRILETKTLKLYLETYREQGIFAEHLASKIAEDIQAALLCNSVSVMLKQRIRGGIETTVFAQLDGGDEHRCYALEVELKQDEDEFLKEFDERRSEELEKLAELNLDGQL